MLPASIAINSIVNLLQWRKWYDSSVLLVFWNPTRLVFLRPILTEVHKYQRHVRPPLFFLAMTSGIFSHYGFYFIQWDSNLQVELGFTWGDGHIRCAAQNTIMSVFFGLRDHTWRPVPWGILVFPCHPHFIPWPYVFSTVIPPSKMLLGSIFLPKFQRP